MVERCAGSVVLRIAEQPIAADARDVEELRVAAGDEQRDEWKRRRGRSEQRRQQVAFHVVHADDRLVQREAERIREARADEERAGEPRALRVGDRVDIAHADAGVGEHLRHERQHALDVLARGELRHDAAVRAVQRDL